MSKHSKGANWEREIAKMISSWWSRSGDDDLLWRTHASGARATSRKKRGKKTRGQIGDLCAVDTRAAKLIKCCPISLKRGYMSMSIQDVMDIEERAKTKEFEGWIKECIVHQRDSDAVGWFLLFRKDRRKTLIFMPSDLVWRFNYKTRHRLLTNRPNCLFSIRKKMKKKKIRKIGSDKYWKWWLKNNCVTFGIPLEDFLNIVTRDEIVAVYKQAMRERNG